MNKQRKTSHILNIFQYDETTGAVTLPSTLDLTAPASNDDSTKVPTTAWVRALASSLGYVTLSTDQSITGLKTIVRVGAAVDVLNFKIGTDTLYGLKVFYSQNELVESGEATWSFASTFNNGSGTGITTTPISFFRGVLVIGQRLLSSSVNANLLDYYGNNPSGRYPIYAYNTGVQQFASSIIVGETAGVVNGATGVIADLPSGVVANFKGRVIGSNAVNSNEFVTLSQLTSGYVNGSGTTNYVSKFTASGSVGNSLIFDNGTTVLIGTTTAPTPVMGVSFPFSVTSSASTRIRIDSTQATPNAGVGLYANGVQKFSFAMFGATSDFTIYNDALLAASILVKGNTNNILIGTSTDNSSKLRVNGTGWFDNTLTATSFVRNGGAATEILAANGSVITAGTGITISGGTISSSVTGGVASFNTRTGAVTLSSGDVTTALGFTPISSYTETDTLASVTGRGATTTSIITINKTGTLISHSGMNDAIGYNASYGTYIGSPVGGTYYIYANGQMNNNGSIVTLLHSGNYNSYSPTLTGGGASGTWGISISGNAATASAVSWANITAGTRTGHGDLRFQPPTSSYAGIQFLDTSGSGAGWFLVRGTSDTDVYTAEGITLVADKGWLTLAQRETAGKGVRIMTGTTSVTRAEFTSAGLINLNATVNLNDNSYFRGSPSYGFRFNNSVDSINALIVDNSGNTFAYTSHRAPIFYDSNNTAYYVDPAGTARLSYVVANGGIRIDGNENLYLDNNYGQSIIGLYTSTRYQGVFAMGNAYKLPIDGSSPGNLYGITWSHPNAGGVAGNLNTHGALILENGTFLAALSGSIRARDDMRAPIFYDSNNTGYYVDAASTTALYDLTIVGAAHKYLYINPGNGYEAMVRYNGGSGSGWYAGKRTSGGINSSADFHFYAEAAANDVFGISTGGTAIASGDMRTPIFYDSNDTGFYIDPNNTSKLSTLNVNNLNSGNVINVGYNNNGGESIATSSARGIELHNPGGRSYWIGKREGSWTQPLDVAFYTGIRYHAELSYNGHRFFVNGYDATEAFSVGNGDANVRVANTLFVSGDARSPIFYDQNNTGFYLDPNGTSNLNSVSISTLNGFALNADNYLGRYGNSYYQVNTWLQFNGTHGIYWPSYYGAHIYTNTSSSYTQLRFDGVKNSYSGVYLGDSAVNGMMYDSGGNGGVYREANGRWYFYYHLGNDCMGVGTSSTSSTYSLYLNKGIYAPSRIDATIYYDASNTGYYLDPNGGSYLASSIEIANGYFLSNGVGGSIRMSSAAGSFGGYFQFAQHAVIETIVGGYHVYVLSSNGNGVVKYDGAQSWSAHSDRRIKTIHSVMQNNLSKLESINPIYYSFNNFNDNTNRIGLIAQEVQEHFPDLVATDPKTDYLTLDYTGLIPVLLGAIKELKNKVEDLESRL